MKDSKASISPNEVNHQAQMGAPPVEMGVISGAPGNNQAGPGYFTPAPQYVSPQQSPLPHAPGQQTPQQYPFPQNQAHAQMLPQQRQLQADMAKSHPQSTQAAPSQPSKYQTAIPLQALSSEPAPVDCPGCGARELTRTEFDVGGTTHGWAAVLCCVALLCCIPYMMRAFKDVNHYCSHCGMYLARWHRSGRTVVKAY